MEFEQFSNEREYQAARAEEQLWRRAKELGVSRRRLLTLMAAAGMGAFLTSCTARMPGAPPQPGPGPAPGANPGPAATPTAEPETAPKGIVKPVPPDLFIQHSGNAEMRWDKMYGRGYVVPNELFFVRSHTATPGIDAAKWRLRVEGSGVTKPLELTYDDLLAMPSTSVIRHLECTGNGRSFFLDKYGKKAMGVQWRLGAIGVAEWTGVPLREVLERAGLKKSARDVMPEGLDTQKVRRPMPVSKALEDDVLLVYAMNGQTLPFDHGFPVRILVPGWVAINSIKWVGRIEVSEQPLFSPWNTQSYVLSGPDYKPVGEAKGPAVYDGTLKSALELAWPGQLAAGTRMLRGRAWSPFGRIARVEYSIDGGPWQQARLTGLNIEKAWVRFEFPWDARPGDHKIRVRATDNRGNAQPDSFKWNDLGYLYNAVVEHPVSVK